MLLRTILTRSSISRSVVAARQLHSSPVAEKTVTEKVTEVADKVNKSVGKGLASAIDTGEKVVGSTKHTFGSAKRKATDTTQEKMNQTSESTKQATENARQKFNQAAAEAGNKADRVQAGFQQVKEDVKSETRK